MPFYIMRQDTLIQGSRAVGEVPAGFEPDQWCKGHKMPDPAPGGQLVFDLSLQSGSYRGHIIDGLVTLYHRRLKEALESEGLDCIDYFPVILRDQNTGKHDTSYFLANILGLIDCVDMAQSQVRWWKAGNGFDFLSMVLDPSKTRGLKLFRLMDDPTKVVISEELKQHFEKNLPLAGVKLVRTEDYRDF